MLRILLQTVLDVFGGDMLFLIQKIWMLMRNQRDRSSRKSMRLLRSVRALCGTCGLEGLILFCRCDCIDCYVG